MSNKNQNTDEPNVILLNKAFIGSWNDETGHISHEIIDFFRADNKKHYVYFSPSGKVNKDIGVINDENSKNTTKNTKYKAQYLLLTSNATIEHEAESAKKETGDDSKTKNKEPQSSTFQIKYIIELGRLINTNEEEIKYGGKTTKEIFDDGEYPSATFVATEIYDTSAIQDNSITTKQFIYQRNRGCLYKDKANDDYKRLKNKIAKLIEGAKRLSINTINEWEDEVKNAKQKETFIDFINKKNDENIYSNILVEILKVDGIFKKFCELAWFEVLPDEQFNLTREKFVKLDENKGRIDIYAESEESGMFIENKILSDLNGIKTDAQNKETSQITLYKRWVKDKHKNSYGILLVPDYRKGEIEKELKSYSEDKLVRVITYKRIADFIAKNKKTLENDRNFKYAKYADELEAIFNKHAYSTKLEKFAADFINAINNIK